MKRKRKMENENMEVNQGLLDIEQAAKFLSISKSKLYHLTSSNEISRIKLGSKVLFTIEMLINYINENTINHKK